VLALALSVLVTQTPAPTRLVIWAGGKTEAEAKQALASFEERRKELLFLQLAPDYPKILDSSKVPGLNAGFFIVALGVCASEADVGFALIDFLAPSTYSKAVTLPLACPDFPEPEPPEAVEYRSSAVERRRVGEHEWSFVTVTSRGNAPEGETKTFTVAVQVRKKGALVDELLVSNTGSFAELEGGVSFTAKGLVFKERNVDPSCAWGNRDYQLTQSRHTIRLEHGKLVDQTQELHSSSGSCE